MNTSSQPVADLTRGTLRAYRPDGGLRIVNAPVLLPLFGAALALVMLVALVAELRRGAPAGRLAAIGAGLAVSVGAVVAFASHSRFDFNSPDRSVAWSRRSLLGRRGGTLSFADVQFAVVQCIRSAQPQGPRTAYRVALVTRDDGILPITWAYDGGRAADAHCRALRSAINSILGVRLASEDENDVRQLLLAGQSVWAAALAAERYNLNATDANHFVQRLAA